MNSYLMTPSNLYPKLRETSREAVENERWEGLVVVVAAERGKEWNSSLTSHFQYHISYKGCNSFITYKLQRLFLIYVLWHYACGKLIPTNNLQNEWK